MPKKNVHQFTLVLSGIVQIDEELENRVFEAGCDDALLGVRDGVVYLDFDRRADSFEEAIVSAVRDVEGAELKTAHIEPDDLVNQSQIAERVGRTRESIRLLVSGERGPGTFPAPISGVKGSMRLWRWSRVAAWLAHEGLLDEIEAKRAALVAELNAALELRNAARLAPPQKPVLDLLRAIQPKRAKSRPADRRTG
jgi:hypothetical protein